MPPITPCLWFDTQGEEAADFYISIFPNSAIHTITRYGPENPSRQGTVMVVDFELDGQRFLALNGGPQFSFSEAISFQVQCADQSDVDHFWSALSDGGDPGPCGWLKDRYGLSWQIVPGRLLELLADPDPDRARRAMEAMLGMQKIDIATVERAADLDTERAEPQG